MRIVSTRPRVHRSRVHARWLIAAVAATGILAACAPTTSTSAPAPAEVAPTTPGTTAPPTTVPPVTTAPRSTTTTTTTTAPRSTTTIAPTTTTAPPTTTTTAPPSGSGAQAPGAGAAASRVIFLTNCWDVVQLTDAQLDTWRGRGVGGFVCGTGYLYDIGGPYRFTGDASSTLTGSTFDLQRDIRNTKIVSRAASRGISLWLGTSMTNYFDGTTPFGNWFDDATWSSKVLPQMANLAGAAKLLGFAGVAFDAELYPGATGKAGTWDWNFPGNTRTESAVRSKVKQRGAQLMTSMVGAYPNVDVIAYHLMLPEGWSELVQATINKIPNAYASQVGIDFWDGMTSVSGYGPIRLMDHVYNKTSHLFQATWDTAFTYDLNRMSAMFSRRLSNWSYASSRLDWGPFAWIDSGPTGYDQARPAPEVATQLAAFRKWGTGGAFLNFAYQGLNGFDYTPYVPGIQAAAVPGTVDTTPPTGTVASTTRSASSVNVSGSATDDLAVRAVRWSAAGASGAATMNWTVLNGTYATGYQWRMDWSASIPAAPGTQITLTFEDVKGLTSTKVVTAP
jgi:hypothetical protein